MKDIQEVLDFLNKNEIDFRLESNHPSGYIFYFLDGSIYPRRFLDYELEGTPEQIIAQTPDNILEKISAYELKKDWRHRIEAESIIDTFKQVKKYIYDNFEIK